MKDYKFELAPQGKKPDIKGALRRYWQNSIQFTKTLRLLRYFGMPAEGESMKELKRPEDYQSYLDACAQLDDVGGPDWDSEWIRHTHLASRIWREFGSQMVQLTKDAHGEHAITNQHVKDAFRRAVTEVMPVDNQHTHF